ncbi:MAG TPA: flagellar motor protein MotB [Ignavibacteria bacterium]
MGKEQIDTDHSEQSTTHIIIVKKGGKGHGGHHGGAWKVAYADFTTAMMAFFIVMWILAQSNAVKTAVQEYFRDPLGFNEKVKAGLLKGSGLSVIPGAGGINPEQAVKESFEETQRRLMTEAANNLKRELEENPEFAKIEDMIDIHLTKEGLMVELLEGDKSSFFDVGSANLKPTTKKILEKIAQEFGKFDNRVIIDGHTDSRPYVAKSGYSNWELSADRANSARKVMESSGLYEGQVLSVRGFADQQLRNPNDPYDVTNRRISILLLNKTKTTNDTLFVKTPN